MTVSLSNSISVADTNDTTKYDGDVYVVTTADVPDTKPVNVKKISSDTNVTSNNPCYSLENAIYYVYDSSTNQLAKSYTFDAAGNVTSTDAILTTNANGDTNTVNLKYGNYYVKEYRSSKGYMLDNRQYSFSLDSTTSGTTTITSTEIPTLDPVSITVTKTDSEGISVVNKTGALPSEKVGSACLEGTVFEICYYNDYYAKASDVSALTPTRKWYVQATWHNATNKYTAMLDTEHLVNNGTYTSDALYYDETNKVSVPNGTITVKEVKAADGYKIEGVMTDESGTCVDNIFIGQIRPNAAYNVTDSDLYIADTDKKQNADLNSYNTRTDGDFDLTNTPNRGDLSFTKVDYTNYNEMEDVFFEIESVATGEKHIVKSDRNGLINTSSSHVSHLANTNAYDRLFDNDPSNDTINGTNIAELDCGVWFFGTANENEWDVSKISDSKGALRYGDYIVRELECDSNEGKQLIVEPTFTVNAPSNYEGIITNVPTPKIKTKEWDSVTRSHSSSPMAANKIIDTVTWSYLTAGKTYTIKGILMELDENGDVVGPLLDAEGNMITASKTFTVEDAYTKSPQEKCGTTDVEYLFNGLGLDDKVFVIYEYLFEGTSTTALTVNGTNVTATGVLVDRDKKEVKHEDSTDTNQIGYFLSIKTKAIVTNTNNNLIEISDKTELSDIVTYNGLIPDTKYSLKATLKYIDATGNIVSIKDNRGNELVGTKEFTSSDTGAGTVRVDMPAFDSNQLLDDNGELICDHIVFYEELLSSTNQLLATEEKIDESSQTIYIVELGTKASDVKSKSQIANPDGTVTIEDVCSFKNLNPNTKYTFSGKIYDKEKNTPLLDSNGKEITASTIYTTGANERNGEVSVTFVFDASGLDLEGKSIVCFEDISYENIVFATHYDISSEAQTIHFPSVKTTLYDKDSKEKIVYLDGNVALTDKVEYTNLFIPENKDLKYLVRGYLVNKVTGEEVMINGERVEGSAEFTPTKDSGSVEVNYYFNVSESNLAAIDGKMPELTCYEELVVLKDASGTGHFVDVTIPGYDAKTFKTKYECTTCNGQFENENDHSAISGCTGNIYNCLIVEDEVVKHEDITYKKYIIDKTELYANQIIAEEKDINNADQTIITPSGKTTALDNDTHDHVSNPDEECTIIDTVHYKDLIPNKEYRLQAQVYLVPENEGDEAEPLLINDKPVYGSKVFTPETSEGDVDVTITFDASSLSGQRIVIFEDCYQKDRHCFAHADIWDTEQQVSFPKLSTKARDKSDNDSTLELNKNVTVVDTISYTNLPVGTYTVNGILMDLSTKKEAIDKDGNQIKATATFEVTDKEQSTGEVSVMYSFNTTGLSNRELVCFEKVYSSNGTLIAEHSDWNDKQQTVSLPEQPQTGFMIKIFIIICALSLIGTTATIIMLRRRKKY